MLISYGQYQTISAGARRLPPPPSREDLCRVRCSLQGLIFEGVNWWDPYLVVPDAPKPYWQDKPARLRFYAQTRAEGNTHLSLTLVGDYATRDQCLQSLDWILPIMQEALTEGGMTGILLNLKGDGSGPEDPDHFDPGSCNFQWLMENFAEIVKRVTDAGLMPYTILSPGFDGVVPGWQPFTKVNEYVQMARDVVGDSNYLALELSSGYCVWSGERNDWVTADGQKFDVILQEFAAPMRNPNPPDPWLLTPDGRNWLGDHIATAAERAPWDQQWQMVGRMVHPYHRPPEQPDNDDPGGAPYLLGMGTPRGPFHYIAYEYDTWNWIKQQNISRATVIIHGQYLMDLGCTAPCGPLDDASLHADLAHVLSARYRGQ